MTIQWQQKNWKGALERARGGGLPGHPHAHGYGTAPAPRPCSAHDTAKSLFANRPWAGHRSNALYWLQRDWEEKGRSTPEHASIR